MNTVFWIVPLSSVVALGFAWMFFRELMRQNEGTSKMKDIAERVRTGAMAYLNQQYKIMLMVFLGLAALFAILAFGFDLQSRLLPIGFLTAGFFSGLAGFFGMKTATYASARTAQAASESLPAGLRVAFRSGAVMGLVVVGLGLLNISIWFVILAAFFQPEAASGTTLMVITTTLLTFSMGASLQALFARVGGGIFTKAADVGADLVGKVEAGIPEDDPRNPATIADNVGDNVGDVAGMGADLYESYTGSIIAACALGAAAFITDIDMQAKAVLFPLLISAAGIILSIVGIYFVRTREGADQKELMGALGRGVNVSSFLILIAAALIAHLIGIENPWGLWGAVAVGLLTGIVIGKSTEYFTSASYSPTQTIARNAQTGHATVIISGVSVGMMSTAIPVSAVVVGTAFAYFFASGFDMQNMSLGLYGIGIAAVGMLSTLGITLGSDAYGPIADNAGGNAEMSLLGPEVRQRTDALDSLGNTTAATGKGFAIGSAALTALALLASYIEVLRTALIRLDRTSLQIGNGEPTATVKATLTELMIYFDVTLLNPLVLLGIFIGSMIAFVFCGLTNNAVGRAAGQMVEEVRRQFKADPGILLGTSEPDHARCIAISTQGAQKEMILPSLLALFLPILVGLVMGVAGVMGLLVGSLATGFVLAIFLANSGGAWDNAKKYIEEGHFGGKGSDAHKAAVTGDTVGDPFKDTSGPSLNILIKLMSIVAIVMATVTLTYSLL